MHLHQFDQVVIAEDGHRRGRRVKTQRTILLIVLGLAGAVAVGVAALVASLGPVGLLGALVGATALVVAYHSAIGPWHRRWGATRDEVRRAMPGDDLVPGSIGSTRAITVRATADAVFPWVVQIGFGRAGWYSYDWIDNDGRPSADQIDHNLQSLAVGDVIPMTPSMGFLVRSIDRHQHTLVSRAEDGTTWAVLVEDLPSGSSRLTSRFRPPPARGLGARTWTLLVDPGAFIMERRMLLGIKSRAEAASSLSG